MRKWTTVLIVLMFLPLSLAADADLTQTPTRESLPAETLSSQTPTLSESIRNVYATMKDKIVRVDLKQEYELVGRNYSTETSASGIVVRQDGLVMLSGFALLGAHRYRGLSAATKEVKVTFLDGGKYDADYVGVDRKLNLGFVRIQAPGNRKFPCLNFSADIPLVLGAPVVVCDLLPEKLGGRLKVEACRIASIITQPDKLYAIHPQAIDAAGAPVLHISGVPVGVIGISSAFGEQAYSYVTGRRCAVFMPSCSFEHLINNPPVKEDKKSWLGVSIRQALTPELAKYWGIEGQKGIIVAHAYKGHPAARAGIRDEDIIVAFAGSPVDISNNRDIDRFTYRVADIPPGTRVQVKVLRRDKTGYVTKALQVTLAEAPRDRFQAEKFQAEDFGITVREPTFDSVDDPEDPQSFLGVIVDTVEPGGWAGLGGMHPGDRILKVGHNDVRNLDDFKRLIALAKQTGEKEVLFFLRRGTGTHYIRAETQWGK